MPGATLTVTQANIRQDNMQVFFGGTDIGGIESVEVMATTKITEKKVNQYGDSPLDFFNAGRRVEVKVVFWETTLDLLAQILFGGVKRTSGGKAVGLGLPAAGTQTGLGQAIAIRLHPADLGDAVLTNDVNVWKAAPLGSWKVAYHSEKYTAYEVTFLVLPDFTKPGKELIDFGLAAAT